MSARPSTSSWSAAVRRAQKVAASVPPSASTTAVLPLPRADLSARATDRKSTAADSEEEEEDAASAAGAGAALSTWCRGQCGQKSRLVAKVERCLSECRQNSRTW